MPVLPPSLLIAFVIVGIQIERKATESVACALLISHIPEIEAHSGSSIV